MIDIESKRSHKWMVQHSTGAVPSRFEGQRRSSAKGGRGVVATDANSDISVARGVRYRSPMRTDGHRGVPEQVPLRIV
jgi:hypothetical protein